MINYPDYRYSVSPGPVTFIAYRSTAFSNLFIRTHIRTMYERNPNTILYFGR